MKYEQAVTLKDGRRCQIRSAKGDEAESVLEHFNLTHVQTDFLLTYPDESSFTIEQERDFLEARLASPRAVFLIALVDGALVGSAGIEEVGGACKLLHRASFGISVDQSYWGLGIGRALTNACIDCAKKAGYLQLELEVVGENTSAISLYKQCGFGEYGRNPKGFRTRDGRFRELVLMRLELRNPNA